MLKCVFHVEYNIVLLKKSSYIPIRECDQRVVY